MLFFFDVIMSQLPQIVLGTYEQFLLGYEILKDVNGEYKLSLNMASHAHVGSIRSVTVNKQFLASAGADEYVNVFNMVNRKEVAVLTPHEGTITSVLFTPDGSHLVSGSQDGNISIFRCTDWTLMKAWKSAHKKPNGVIGLSVHPSGKLVLSIGADHIMRVWNMVKGRQAYAVNFGKKITAGNDLNMVTWSGDGDQYAVVIGNTAYIYDTLSAAIIYAVKCDSRISSIDMSLDDLIFVGRDDGKLEIHNFKAKEALVIHETHDKRIKCVKSFRFVDKNIALVTADSQGMLRIWQLEKNSPAPKISQKAEINADCRVLCMALLDPSNLVKKEETSNNLEEIEKSIVDITKTACYKSPKNGHSSPPKKKKDKKTDDQSEELNSSSITKDATPRKRKSVGEMNSSWTKTDQNSKTPTSNKKRKSNNFIASDDVVNVKVSKRKSFSTNQWTVA